MIPLLHAVHMNPKNHPDPLAFKPERFLSEDGKEYVRPEAFMPFGKGRRECLGDHLAERQFFLFFASMFHTMDISPEDPDNMPSLKATAGITVTPSNFKINVVPREAVRENLEDLLSIQDMPLATTATLASTTIGAAR